MSRRGRLYVLPGCLGAQRDAADLTKPPCNLGAVLEVVPSREARKGLEIRVTYALDLLRPRPKPEPPLDRTLRDRKGEEWMRDAREPPVNESISVFVEKDIRAGDDDLDRLWNAEQLKLLARAHHLDRAYEAGRARRASDRPTGPPRSRDTDQALVRACDRTRRLPGAHRRPRPPQAATRRIAVVRTRASSANPDRARIA